MSNALPSLYQSKLVIQEPRGTVDDKPAPLPPFALPEVGEGEVATPRILAINPRVRGKRNPIMGIDVGGQTFVQYRLPSDWTVPGVDQTQLRPNLPVVKLTDKQVEALKERAKLIIRAETYRPPSSDDDALVGYHEIAASEYIVIADYSPTGDPFRIASEAMRAAEAAQAAQNTEPVIDGADEVEKAENALRGSNDEPQRGEDKAAVAGGKNGKVKGK